MVHVWDLREDGDIWNADQVVSKCYIIPRSEVKKNQNPLPDEIRKLKDAYERRIKFAEMYEQTDRISWDILSLLLPPDETIQKLLKC